jgi:hypothetical protein
MAELPVDHLSVSSIRTLRMCPEKWRRKYVEREYEPPNGKMTLGKVFGAAEAQSDHTWIESGEPLDTDAVLDSYSDEFEQAASEDVDWQGEVPAKMKDSGAETLRIYHATVPALPAPVEAEREVRLDVEGVEFLGYIDVEREDGAVEDRKLVGRKISQSAADADPQASAYLAARRAEEDPAERFVFDAAVRTKQPQVQRVETNRTDEQLDHFLASILGAAEEIEWRLETDNWSFAPPGAFWCGESSCGYWDSCPAGGLLRKRAAEVVAA